MWDSSISTPTRTQTNFQQILSFDISTEIFRKINFPVELEDNLPSLVFLDDLLALMMYTPHLRQDQINANFQHAHFVENSDFNLDGLVPALEQKSRFQFGWPCHSIGAIHPHMSDDKLWCGVGLGSLSVSIECPISLWNNDKLLVEIANGQLGQLVSYSFLDDDGGGGDGLEIYNIYEFPTSLQAFLVVKLLTLQSN
ncbi:hypothetical protein ACH5RR_014186 [Cinchona calisaya]|uniref:Uncharacterized protein n=1 Tax=Cinchona calisaya TaxID=153742 RepID=A0ABD3A3J6_9GENT